MLFYENAICLLNNLFVRLYYCISSNLIYSESFSKNVLMGYLELRAPMNVTVKVVRFVTKLAVDVRMVSDVNKATGV